MAAKVAPSIIAALNAEPAKRTPAQKAELAKFFRENADNPAKRAEAAVAAAKKALDAVYADVSSTMVMKELPQPREAFILNRGEYDKPGDVVRPRAARRAAADARRTRRTTGSVSRSGS